MTVHNHGTEDGPGLACPESRVSGELKGKCMNAVSVIPDTAVKALAAVLVEDGAYGVPWGDASGDDRAEATSKARRYLTIASPHMLALAWDAAVAEGESGGWIHDYAADDLRKRNPYGPAK